MNLFPYNSGHMMVVPYKHTSKLESLSDAAYVEVMHATAIGMRALGKVSGPHGFNLGANLGRVAGAGIDKHIHFHIVPRWNGDTNFMPVLSEAKLISEDLKRTWARLKKAVKERG
jgi:ATP adenylyltransferase